MSDSTPVLSLSNIRKSFAGAPVLRDISLDVTPGEVVAIVGPSGGGKSTLLRCAAMLEQIDAGEISYGELRVATTGSDGRAAYATGAELKRAKARLGFVFQSYNLFPHMSVMRNIIDAPLAVQKRSRADVEVEAHELIKKMGLDGCEDKVPCQLSGGQQQRASIARALALKPEMLFFDEPTSALDPELTGEVLKVIRQLAAEDITMVIVTHEMSFAREVADRVIFMDGGLIVEEGAPEEVLGNPREERTRAFLQRLAN